MLHRAAEINTLEDVTRMGDSLPGSWLGRTGRGPPDIAAKRAREDQRHESGGRCSDGDTTTESGLSQWRQNADLKKALDSRHWAARFRLLRQDDPGRGSAAGAQNWHGFITAGGHAAKTSHSADDG